jgi:putative oxidoreductase
MNRARTANIIAWAVSVLLALGYVAAGLPKILGDRAMVLQFAHWGYPRWFVPVIGSVELLGSILLLVPRAARIGVIILAVVMAGAAYTLLSHGEGLQVLAPIAFSAGLGVVFWLRKRPART